MQDFRTCARGLCRTARPAAWRIALSVVIGVIMVALSLAFVWTSKMVVDCATGAIDRPLGQAVAAMAAVMALELVFSVVKNYWNGYITIKSQISLTAGIYEKVMYSTWSGKDRFHSGDAVNRLEMDVTTVVNFLCSTLPACFVTIIQFVAACIFMYNLSPQLALIIVFIMPVAVIASKLFFHKLRELTNEIRAVDSRIQGHVQESIQHRVLIKTLGATTLVLRKMKLLQNESLLWTCRRLNYGAVSRFFMHAGFVCGYAAAFFWGAYGLKDGSVTYGLMVAFLQLVNQIQRPVAELSAQIPAFIRALSSEDRLLELEDQPQEVRKSDVVFEGAPGIRLSDVSYSYPDGDEPVLRNLSFDFKPGTMTVITGPTGAGKSSLLRILLALLKPQAGSVVMYGGGKEQEIGVDTRINFMYVPQGNTLLSGTIRDNLRMACPDADDDQMKEALHMAEADFVMNLPDGLDTAVAEIGNGLSEGQAQRVSIARALLHPGGVLVLDEATSALDEGTEERLLSNISERCRGHKTIICVTHRPAAVSYADAELKITQ